jgi:hypothetical protein
MKAMKAIARYTVGTCGCVRYHGDGTGPAGQTIVWCGTIDRDVAALRAALTTAKRRTRS